MKKSTKEEYRTGFAGEFKPRPRMERSVKILMPAVPKTREAIGHGDLTKLIKRHKQLKSIYLFEYRCSDRSSFSFQMKGFFYIIEIKHAFR